MGGGSWTTAAFVNYSKSTGKRVTLDGTLDNSYTQQDIFQSRKLAPELDPLNVIRECKDTDEHPETIPVILALDVTGSMGPAAVECAKKLNEIMTTLYDKIKDVEFMIMAIGDLAYDRAPIQISQFESDVRIAEQLDKVYFEGGGGGNGYESYTAAWYMGARHTRLDCLKRGKKGIIITLGDELLNPYLPKDTLAAVTGDKLQANIETADLYNEVSDMYEIYHIAVDDINSSYKCYEAGVKRTFGKYLDGQHFIISNLDKLSSTIVDIVSGAVNQEKTETTSNEISW